MKIIAITSIIITLICLYTIDVKHKEIERQLIEDFYNTTEFHKGGILV